MINAREKQNEIFVRYTIGILGLGVDARKSDISLGLFCHSPVTCQRSRLDGIRPSFKYTNIYPMNSWSYSPIDIDARQKSMCLPVQLTFPFE